MIKYAEDICKEIDDRGTIKIPNNCVTGEEFEKWLHEEDAETQLTGGNKMFEYSKNLMNKIRNKEDLTLNEIMTIERSLRLYEVNDDILNYQMGLHEDNKYQLTEHLKLTFD